MKIYCGEHDISTVCDKCLVPTQRANTSGVVIDKPTKEFTKGMCEVGDVIVDKNGNEFVILEVGETSFLRSYTFGRRDMAYDWNTYKEAIKKGWTFKDQQTPQPCTSCNGTGVKS